ncbi:hypothetical protein K1719_033135 [Acacia pycnantha]|nr:hypothetical protein K1719_033135 [Acacia pycnantha]
MATSSHTYKAFLSLILLALLLLADSCSATMRLREGTDIIKRKINERKMNGFVYRGLAFNFFPKGFPIPPSGPSKRHNSKVDSGPQN